MTARATYQRNVLILSASVLGALLCVILVAILGAEEFDGYAFFRFPFGFWILAQGLLLAIAAAGFWFARVAERLDRELAENREF